MTVLRNESRSVEGLTVAGVDDLWAGRFRPAEALAGLDPATPAVVLCHNPDAVDRAGLGRVPGVGAGRAHARRAVQAAVAPPPMLNRAEPAVRGRGVRPGGRAAAVRQPGLGYVQKVRFNARPEVTLFRLVAG